MTLTVKFGRWKDNLRKLPPISYPLFKELNCFILPEGNCRDRNLANFATFFQCQFVFWLTATFNFFEKKFFFSFFPIKFGNSPFFTFYLTLFSTFWEFFGVLVTNCKFWLQVFIQLNPLLDGFLFPSRSYWL